PQRRVSASSFEGPKAGGEAPEMAGNDAEDARHASTERLPDGPARPGTWQRYLNLPRRVRLILAGYVVAAAFAAGVAIAFLSGASATSALIVGAISAA